MNLEEIRADIAENGITPNNLIQGFRYDAVCQSGHWITLIPSHIEPFWYCQILGPQGQVYTKRPVNKSAVHFSWVDDQVAPANSDWKIAECEPAKKNPFIEQAQPPIKGFIYFIQCVVGGPVKIGYANSVRKRITEIQFMCPFELRVLGVMDGTIQAEKSIHNKFAKLRDHGEWFSPDDELMRFIEENTTRPDYD